jgi:hypothetical protein
VHGAEEREMKELKREAENAGKETIKIAAKWREAPKVSRRLPSRQAASARETAQAIRGHSRPDAGAGAAKFAAPRNFR